MRRAFVAGSEVTRCGRTVLVECRRDLFQPRNLLRIGFGVEFSRGSLFRKTPVDAFREQTNAKVFLAFRVGSTFVQNLAEYQISQRRREMADLQVPLHAAGTVAFRGNFLCNKSAVASEIPQGNGFAGAFL